MLDSRIFGFQSLLLYGAFVVSGWVAVVRARRWDYYNAIHEKYGRKWDNGRGTITPEEAQIVFHLSNFYDLPLIMYYSLSFALFKTYGIPSISKILLATKELSSGSSVARRYADTDTLITTFTACPISGFRDPDVAAQNRSRPLDHERKAAEDPRAMIALARVNWLHAHYKISNEDYLYTLSLFIMEPAVWARQYGWRKLSPLEEHCFFVLWKELGRRMDIQNIPESLAEMRVWSKQYETLHMVPSTTNRDTGRQTINELLAVVPGVPGLKRFAENLTICLLEDIVRDAMMLPKQPWFYHVITYLVMKAFAIFQGWFLLPRQTPMYGVDTNIWPNSGDAPGLSCPRLHPVRCTSRPWYRQEANTGLGYIRDKIFVALGRFKEMPGPQFKSTGYRLEEMGPIKFENVGHEEIMRQAAELQGCPVVGPWSLEVKDRLKEA